MESVTRPPPSFTIGIILEYQARIGNAYADAAASNKNAPTLSQECLALFKAQMLKEMLAVDELD